MSTFEQIVNFYTSDQEVQNLMYSTRIIWMVGFIADMTQGVCSGIIFNFNFVNKNWVSKLYFLRKKIKTLSHKRVILIKLIYIIKAKILYNFSLIIRAMGYQSFAMKTGVIFFWLIMIPVSYTVGVIMELNTKGVYLGVPIGAGLQASTYIYILFYSTLERNCRESISYR